MTPDDEIDPEDKGRPVDPAVLSALTRDGITLTEIGRLVDLNYKHTLKWAVAGTAAAQRRAKYEALSDWVAGRTIAKPDPESPSRWVMEPVRQDVSVGELAHLKARVDEAVAALADASRQLSGALPREPAGVTREVAVSYAGHDENRPSRNAAHLTGVPDGVTLPDMLLTPNIIELARQDYEKSYGGVTMVNKSIKLPPGLQEEVTEVVEQELGMGFPEFIRVVLHACRRKRGG